VRSTGVYTLLAIMYTSASGTVFRAGCEAQTSVIAAQYVWSDHQETTSSSTMSRPQWSKGCGTSESPRMQLQADGPARKHVVL
jgi:hypothetical protein